MEKNEIINMVIESLMKQRCTLVEELASMNHNEASFAEQRITIDTAINNIDASVSNHMCFVELKTVS